MKRMISSVAFLAATLSLSVAHAQTTGGNSPSALGACISQLSETQNQLNQCRAQRAPNGDICVTTLGAQLIDGRCQCPPVRRHGRMRDQVPVPERLPNGNMALGCGTPHVSQPNVASDRVWVVNQIHVIVDPLIVALTRRVTVVEGRVTSVEQQVATLTSRVDALRTAMQRLCRPLDAQAPSSGAPATPAPATPANTDAALIAQCGSLHDALERESQALTALAARVSAQGDELDQVDARTRDHEARIAALEAVWRGIEGRYSRRLITVGLFLGGAGSFPIGGSEPTGFGRLGVTLRVPIASSNWSFLAQGEGGAGVGGLGPTLAFGGRIGVGYRLESSVLGFSLGASGRNFWAPWQPPPGIVGSNRGWNVGGYAAIQLHLGDRVIIEPWVEVGVGRSMGHTPQGLPDDAISPIITPGLDLVINLNR